MFILILISRQRLSDVNSNCSYLMNSLTLKRALIISYLYNLVPYVQSCYWVDILKYFFREEHTCQDDFLLGVDACMHMHMYMWVYVKTYVLHLQRRKNSSIIF